MSVESLSAPSLNTRSTLGDMIDEPLGDEDLDADVGVGRLEWADQWHNQRVGDAGVNTGMKVHQRIAVKIHQPEEDGCGVWPLEGGARGSVEAGSQAVK
jgi:hypothetical protein